MKKKKMYFGGAKRYGISVIHVAVILLLSCFFGITIAFFFDSDYADNTFQMSGAVVIEAVGENGSSIEDVEDEDGLTSKLVINLVDNYKYLIPGAPLSIPVSCKVYQSTTSPLLRASFNLKLYRSVDDAQNPLEEVDLNELFPAGDDRRDFLTDVSDQISSKIISHGWYLYNGYYYYVGNDFKASDDKGANTILEEVDVTQSNVIIDFIKASSRKPDGTLEGDPIIFPPYVDPTFSGLNVILSITFQGIQNYLPESLTNGDQVDNTIANSLLIFDSVPEDSVETPEL